MVSPKGKDRLMVMNGSEPDTPDNGRTTPQDTPFDRYLERIPQEQRGSAQAWASTDDKVFKAEVGMMLHEIKASLERPQIRAQVLVFGGAATTATLFASINDDIVRVLTGIVGSLMAII